MDKLEAEFRRKVKTERTSDTMHLFIHRSLSEAVTSLCIGIEQAYANTLEYLMLTKSFL